MKKTGYKAFLEKRGQETLKEAILDWMSEMIPNATQAIAIEKGLLIAFTHEDTPDVSRRVPSLLIAVAGDTQDALEQETPGIEDNTGYGERAMMRLFDYLLINEQECWIVDTDVLNWNLNMGYLRSREDLWYMVGNFSPQIYRHSIKSTFFDYFECESDMVNFMIVELNDYMS